MVSRYKFLLILPVLGTSLAAGRPAWCSEYKVLHSFYGDNQGGNINAGVVFDTRGNLYGVTAGGGTYGYGVLFKLKPEPTGAWIEKVLHSFNGNPDGTYPNGTLVFDAGGDLYGTTELGGNGYGTVFSLTPGPTGWTFGLLHTFCSEPDCSDGGSPWSGVAMDGAGNLYGTAALVFELSPGPNGWTENVLYTFCSQPNCTDGGAPYAGVIFGNKGDLYGTTHGGGAYHLGTAYRLKHLQDGSWKETVLHSFGDPNFLYDGRLPGLGTLVIDDQANLYGTTSQGGRYTCGTAGCGTIFKLTRQPDGHWQETIIHQFKKISTGYGPVGGLVMDTAGNLYGTTIGGGTKCDCGVIYKLTLQPDGSYAYSVLHSFDAYHGAQPAASMIFDAQGNLYGTAKLGPGGGGVVFELTP